MENERKTGPFFEFFNLLHWSRILKLRQRKEDFFKLTAALISLTFLRNFTK